MRKRSEAIHSQHFLQDKGDISQRIDEHFIAMEHDCSYLLQLFTHSILLHILNITNETLQSTTSETNLT